MLASMKNKLKTVSAFSLIELLVVISIIAILMTLLTPMISTAIATAQRVKCASNMRSLGQAFASYAAEHNGELPPAHTGPGCWIECTSYNRKQKIEGIKRGKLWPYVEDLSIYRCPGTYGFMKDYVRNYSMVGAFDRNLAGSQMRWKKLTEVMRPSTTLLLVEDFDWRGWNQGSWIMQPSGRWYYWVDYLPGNHRGGDNFLFCDGHVEYRRYEDPETLSVYDPRHFYLPDPDGRNPDMDWIGKRYKSIYFYENDGTLKDRYKNNPPWNK